MAGGLLLVVFILLIVGIKGCVDSNKRSSLRHYNSNVAKLARRSDAQGRALFAALGGGGGGKLDQAVSSARDDAKSVLDKARKLDVPSEMKMAQRYLLDTLTLRSQALDKIAPKIGDALSHNRSTASSAIASITGQMQLFLASDVIYSVDAAQLIKRALDKSGVHGLTVPQSHYLAAPLVWLNAQTVADKLGSAGANTPTPKRGKPAPGTHGHSLDSISIGSQQLTSSGNRVPVSANPAVKVKITNGGSNDETAVLVKVTISGQGFSPITAQKLVAKTKAGQSLTVTIPLPQAPPVGRSGKIKAEVAGVPGEKNLANNSQTFPVTFTR
ncbi:MAG TPA: hypothetical protein VHE14_06215 [Solirubrobacteraceae bacterium]|nr:hypothetical protein [Solirubrobacteraceae bacterium]